MDVMGGSIGGGDRGSGPPPPPPPRKKSPKIGFLRNTGPDPLKITKLPSKNAMFGHYRHASETPRVIVSFKDLYFQPKNGTQGFCCIYMYLCSKLGNN